MSTLSSQLALPLGSTSSDGIEAGPPEIPHSSALAATSTKRPPRPSQRVKDSDATIVPQPDSIVQVQYPLSELHPLLGLNAPFWAAAQITPLQNVAFAKTFDVEPLHAARIDGTCRTWDLIRLQQARQILPANHLVNVALYPAPPSNPAAAQRILIARRHATARVPTDALSSLVVDLQALPPELLQAELGVKSQRGLCTLLDINIRTVWKAKCA
jgi:hypothetical protein